MKCTKCISSCCLLGFDFHKQFCNISGCCLNMFVFISSSSAVPNHMMLLKRDCVCEEPGAEQRSGLTTDARGRMEGFHLQFCQHEPHRGNTVQHNESEERLCQQSCTVQGIPRHRLFLSHGDPRSFVASEIKKRRKTMPNMKSVLK